PPVMPEDPYAYVVAAFQAPPSPDFVPGLEYPPLPDFVPELVYPEFMPLEDEVLPAEEQPLPAALSPTADLPGYVPESDPEEDLEEDDDEDPEEDPVDYPVNGVDDGDDEDESSDDDEDDDVDINEDEEEEHLTPADSTIVALPAVDHAPSAEETKPIETNESAATPLPHPAYRVTARISIRDEPPIPFWSDTEVARLLAIPTPPPSPLSLWSSPLPQIPSPPLPSILSPLPLRAEAPSTSHSLPLPPPIILSHTRSDAPSSRTPPLLPIPTPTSSPPLLLPSTNCREDRPESSSDAVARPTRGPRADYDFVTTMYREMRPAPATDDTELDRRMTEFATRVRQDIDEIYTRFTDGEREARMSREAWGRSMDASDLARSKVMSLRTTVLGQHAMITELQAADHRRQAAITELLAADCRRQAQFIEALKLLKILQTQMTEFESQ
ncbi:hypothetical protein Tco_1062761, partial [Tanacetum coccineum]